MPNLLKTVDTHIYQPKNGSVTPCFALPGQNLPPTYCNVDITIRVGVDDKHDIWASVVSGRIYESVNPSEYHVNFVASRSDFKYSYSGGHLVWSGDGIELEPETVVDATSGNFNWGFPSSGNWARIGNTSNMDGYIWVAGTGTYSVTDPIYPDPVRVAITDWEELLDYFPFAIAKSKVWMSCNREGGSVQRRISNKWQDQTNNVEPEDEQHAYVRTDDKWVKSEKIGKE